MFTLTSRADYNRLLKESPFLIALRNTTFPTRVRFYQDYVQMPQPLLTTCINRLTSSNGTIQVIVYNPFKEDDSPIFVVADDDYAKSTIGDLIDCEFCCTPEMDAGFMVIYIDSGVSQSIPEINIIKSFNFNNFRQSREKRFKDGLANAIDKPDPPTENTLETVKDKLPEIYKILGKCYIDPKHVKQAYYNTEDNTLKVTFSDGSHEGQLTVCSGTWKDGFDSFDFIKDFDNLENLFRDIRTLQSVMNNKLLRVRFPW